MRSGLRVTAAHMHVTYMVRPEKNYKSEWLCTPSTSPSHKLHPFSTLLSCSTIVPCVVSANSELPAS